MTSAIKDYVEKCDICRRYESRQQKETLIPHEIPSRPWAKVGTDLFQVKNSHYMVTVDYYSSFIEVDRLEEQTSKEVIKHLKRHFSRCSAFRHRHSRRSTTRSIPKPELLVRRLVQPLAFPYVHIHIRVTSFPLKIDIPLYNYSF